MSISMLYKVYFLLSVTIAFSITTLALAPTTFELPDSLLKHLPVVPQCQYEFNQITVISQKRIELLISLRDSKGNYLIRNRLYAYSQENKQSSQLIQLTPSKPNNFWDAIMESDQIALWEVTDNQKAKFLSLLSGKPFKISTVTPPWIYEFTRLPGFYPIPLKDGQVISGPYHLPLLGKNFKGITAFFDYYRKLPANEEKEFLFKLLQSQNNFSESILHRLSALGNFRQPLSKYEIAVFQKLYLSGCLQVSEKRFLLENLGQTNFHCTKIIFEKALADISVCDLAGQIYYKEDQLGFSQLMLRYAQTDTNWEIALRQSERLFGQLDCLQLLRRHYHKDMPPQKLKYFIPILLGINKNTYVPEVAEILQRPSNGKNFELFRQTVKWLYRLQSETYVIDLKKFLQKNMDNEFICESNILPMIWVILCKAHDSEGYRLAYDGLLKLKKKGSIEQSVALAIFRQEYPQCKTFDEIIAKVRADFSDKK
jgi:hypothetical protein